MRTPDGLSYIKGHAEFVRLNDISQSLLLKRVGRLCGNQKWSEIFLEGVTEAILDDASGSDCHSLDIFFEHENGK